MDFVTPDGCRFQIPDDWWAFAEMDAFSVNGARCFPVDPEGPDLDRIELVPLAAVEPPTRNPGVAAFKKAKLMPVLFAVRAGGFLPPIEVCRIPGGERFAYRVSDGFHRYYVSAAVGYPQLPILDHGPCVE
jgi:hypothetical protein